ncbi:hypothetical protein VaNZ11_012186 [Volvox africanus]|uniref:GAG-pre-integrase domain-containing protein n=1 Tax=Volvox africanus TaxID=51714 RepID=A0ABQ5SDJ5_9CHLO|nr:hypothetical protein VaNZ11_012186 [Volvox africanus]
MDCNEDLTDYVEVNNGPVMVGAFGVERRALGYGMVLFMLTVHGEDYDKTVENVWYVPGLGHRLLSLGRLDEKGCRVDIAEGGVVVSRKKKNDRHYIIIMMGYRAEGESGVYHMDLWTATHWERVMSVAVLEESIDLWHWFEHLGHDGLSRLVKEEMTEGLPLSAAQVEKAIEGKRTCEPCIRAKQTSCITSTIRQHVQFHFAMCALGRLRNAS